jgi:hypothetical protein
VPDQHAGQGSTLLLSWIEHTRRHKPPATVGLRFYKRDYGINIGYEGLFCSDLIPFVAFIEVLIGVAILYRFARHRSYKAEDDLPYGCEVL